MARPVRLAWWCGLALLTVAALRMTAFSGRDASTLEEWFVPDFRGVVISGIVALAAVVLARSRGGAPVRKTPWLFLVILAVLAGSMAAGIAPGVPGDIWPWALSAALALLGVVLVAAGRGHALRLQVQVRKGDTTDPAGTAYVLARLQELGTSPPEGLRTPRQVDITDLPSDALSSLPAGK